MVSAIIVTSFSNFHQVWEKKTNEKHDILFEFEVPDPQTAGI